MPTIGNIQRPRSIWHALVAPSSDVSNVFWRRWTSEYLLTLHERQRWQGKVRSHKKDDIVIVEDLKLPRGQWPLGKVLEVTPGRDGLVRSAMVLCKDKKFRRPFTQLYMLEEA